MGKSPLQAERETQLQELVEDIRKMIAELKTLINDTRAAIARSHELLTRMRDTPEKKGEPAILVSNF